MQGSRKTTVVTIIESIEIICSPEDLWSFIIHLNRDQKFKKWHPKDHIRIVQFKGSLERVGAIAYYEEYLGKHHTRFVIKVAKVRKYRYIEFKPLFPISLLQFGKGYFKIDKTQGGCRFTIFLEYGYKRDLVGPFAKWLVESCFVKESDIRKHTKEELIILKEFLEKKPITKPHGSMEHHSAADLEKLTGPRRLRGKLKHVVYRVLS